METLNMNAHADASLKHYFYQMNRFSDMINAVCFNGEEVVLQQSLHSKDSDVSVVFDFINTVESLNAARDIIMRASDNGIYVIIAIENQKGMESTDKIT